MAIAGKAVGVHSTIGTLVPAMMTLPTATGQTFKTGEFLKYDGSGNVIVCTADPGSGSIVGISLQPADTNPGFQAANTPATITGRNQTVTIAIPNDNTIFAAQFTNNSSTVIAPALTDVGVQYGITAYTGVWTVDKSKTGGSARVTIVGVDVVQQLVFFRIISSFLA